MADTWQGLKTQKSSSSYNNIAIIPQRPLMIKPSRKHGTGPKPRTEPMILKCFFIFALL